MKRLVLHVSMSWFVWQVHALSIQEYIQCNGMPVLIDGIIDLSECELTSLEGLHYISQPEKITHLYFANNLLTTLPTGIFDKFINLEGLALTNNLLQKIPEHSFDKLTQLTRLELDGNALCTLPKGILDHMPALGTLDLSRNKLCCLPSGIFAKTPKLHHIELHKNKLTVFEPDTFMRLPRLRVLSLSDNRIAGAEQYFMSMYLPNAHLENPIDFEKPMFEHILEFKQLLLLQALECNVLTKERILVQQLRFVPQQGQLVPRVHVCDNLGNTVLHTIVLGYIAKYGPNLSILALIREILRIWPDMLKVKNNGGRTPLHVVAGLKSNRDAYRLFCELLVLGNRKERLLIMKDNDGNTPIQVALHNKHTAIVRALQRVAAL